MTQKTSKKGSTRKKLLWAGLILVVIAAGIYWYVATEKFSDTKDRESAYTLEAGAFIQQFKDNDSLANATYTNKIITINGKVSEVEAADTTMNIKFIDSTSGSYIIFAFQSQHLAEAKTIKPGDTVSLKGACSGGVYYELLDQYGITFQRGTLNK